MKILHVYKDYFPVLGGIENHIRALAQYQCLAGHQVSVLVCEAQGRAKLSNLVCDSGANDKLETGQPQIVRASRFCTLASMPISFSQPWYLLKSRADVIHVHSPYPLAEAASLLFPAKQAIVTTWHSDVVRQKHLLMLHRPFLKRFIKRANRIIVTSTNYLDSSPWLQDVREKCEVIALGVDAQRFSPPTIPYSGKNQVLYVGKLRHYKGLDVLLKAVHLLPDVHLRIVGSGPLSDSLHSLARDLSIESRLNFCGEISEAELPSLYQQASLFVLPSTSRAEAFGTVLLEAMASGLACITTDLGTGTTALVRQGENGFVVKPGDAFALAAVIKEALQNRARLEQFGLRSREIVEKEFRQETMFAAVDRLYQQL